MALPPSMFGGSGDDKERDDRYLNDDVSEALERAKDDAREGQGNASYIDNFTLSEVFDKYAQGSGFNANTWLNAITNIRELEIFKDTSGNWHYNLSFDFETDDGYSGSRSVSG